ncbi:hypothetical protein D3C76_822650 [compost metagenome]
MHRPERRRLVALCRPGEAAPADRLDAPGLRPGLAPPAAPHERHLVLLQPLQPVALREAGGERAALPAGPPAGLQRQPGGLQRARRTHGLAALRAAAGHQPAAPGRRRPGRRQEHGGLYRRATEERPVALRRRRPGQPAEPPAQPVRLALQSARLLRQGPRVHAQVPARHPQRRARQGPGRVRKTETRRGGLEGRSHRGQARPAGDPGLPHVHHLPVLGRGAAHRHLVREGRPQHLGHAPLHPPAHRRHRPGLGSAQRLADLRRHRPRLRPPVRRPPGRGNRPGDPPPAARQPRRAGPARGA